MVRNFFIYAFCLTWIFQLNHATNIPNNTHIFVTEYPNASVSNWSVPNGVYSLHLVLMGAGGGGGGASGLAGGGGGAGATLKATLFVHPGDLFSVQVGQGGLGLNVSNTSFGFEGGNTTFNDTFIFLQAGGGQGGNNDVLGLPPAQGGIAIVNNVTHFQLAEGQAACALSGGSSTQGDRSGYFGSLALPACAAGAFGAGGAGALGSALGGTVGATAGSDGFISISYVQLVTFS
jgi:hypothetical protein